MGIRPQKYHRRSIRLRGYDYAAPGAYFLTVCVINRQSLLGDVVNEEMRLNWMGRAVQAVWQNLPCHYAHVELDAFVVMPNHVHGILVLTDDAGAAAEHADVGAGSEPAPTREAAGHMDVGAGFKPAPTVRHGLPEIVRAFKTFSSRRINEMRGTVGAPLWQRNYYEHIVRNEEELGLIRQYILYNPLGWTGDRENPEQQCQKDRRRARGAEWWRV
jgi:REP element-mobilizing transposase RayT